MPVLVAVRDLVFRSKIRAAAERLGVALSLAPRDAPLADAARALSLAPRDAPLADAARALGGGTILLDLSEPGALGQVAEVKRAAPVRIVGFLGHLEEDLARAASAAGVDEVLSRGRFVQRLDDVLRDAAKAP